MPRKELQYTRAFNRWKRDFSAAALKDNYAELLRPFEHLKLQCSGNDALVSTVSLVSAIVDYCRIDGRDCETFLKQQQYQSDTTGENEYRLLFDLTGPAGSYFGRVLTDSSFTAIDFEDLFNHSWQMSKKAGFTNIYITRLDGEPIGGKELESLYQEVASDMYSGYSEDEVAVDISVTEFPDTAMIYAVETDDESGVGN